MGTRWALLGQSAAQGSRRDTHCCHFHSTVLLRSKEEPLAPRCALHTEIFQLWEMYLNPRREAKPWMPIRVHGAWVRTNIQVMAIRRNSRGLLTHELAATGVSILQAVLLFPWIRGAIFPELCFLARLSAMSEMLSYLHLSSRVATVHLKCGWCNGVLYFILINYI